MSNKKKSISADSLKDRKKQSCGRCKVHGIKDVPLSGHKRDCKHRNCKCPKCQNYLRQRKSSAIKIARTRRLKLTTEKGVLSQEMPPSYVSSDGEKRCHLHILLDHTYDEICRAWWFSPRIKCILRTLKHYANFFDDGVKIDSFLEDAKDYMTQVIHGPMSFMPFQYPACCYISPGIVGALEEKPFVGIRPHYSFQALPDLIPKFQPISTTTSFLPDVLLNVSTKPSIEPSIKPIIDPSTESSTDPTDLTTHIGRSLTRITEIN